MQIGEVRNKKGSKGSGEELVRWGEGVRVVFPVRVKSFVVIFRAKTGHSSLRLIFVFFVAVQGAQHDFVANYIIRGVDMFRV